jgi:hypothetical protein
MRCNRSEKIKENTNSTKNETTEKEKEMKIKNNTSPNPKTSFNRFFLSLNEAYRKHIRSKMEMNSKLNTALINTE